MAIIFKPSDILTYTTRGKPHIQIYEEHDKEIEKIKKEAIKEFIKKGR